jgi:hypothetical protein
MKKTINYDKTLCIRISEEQLAWLDMVSDLGEGCSTSEIIRGLIDKQIHQEEVYLEEYRKEQLEEQKKTRLVEDECQ